MAKVLWFNNLIKFFILIEIVMHFAKGPGILQLTYDKSLMKENVNK